jgi:hypothetical protein
LITPRSNGLMTRSGQFASHRGEYRLRHRMHAVASWLQR